MKIQIIGEPIALCKVDMQKFKKHLKKNLDLKGSIEKSVEIHDKGKFQPESLFKYVWLGLNWGRILEFIHNNDDDKMVIRFFKCKYERKVEFTPDYVSPDGRTFLFKIDSKDDFDVIMINSFIPNPDFNLKCYLDTTTFNYGRIRWKPLMEE